MRRFLIVLVATFLGGCGGGAVEGAHKAVAYQLKDPDSAKFRNDREMANGSVCGQVNGKNAFGAYAGFSHYAAIKSAAGFDVLIDTDNSNKVVGDLCGYQVALVQTVAVTCPAIPAAKGGEIAGVRWSVQLGSIASADMARALTEKLAGYGFTPYVTREDSVSKVFVGPYDTRAMATAKMDQLRLAHKLKGFIVRYREQSGLSQRSIQGLEVLSADAVAP